MGAAGNGGMKTWWTDLVVAQSMAGCGDAQHNGRAAPAHNMHVLHTVFRSRGVTLNNGEVQIECDGGGPEKRCDGGVGVEKRLYLAQHTRIVAIFQLISSVSKFNLKYTKHSANPVQSSAKRLVMKS